MTDDDALDGTLQETALAELFTRDGFPKPRLTLDPSDHAVADPRLLFLRAYWRAAAPGAEPPPAAALDFLDPSTGFDAVSLIESVDGGDDYHFKRFGHAAAAGGGSTLAGRRLSEAGLHEPLRALVRASYRLAAAHGVPVLTEHAAVAGAATNGWRRLVLPFGGGERFLVGAVPLGSGSAARPDPRGAAVLSRYRGPFDDGSGLRRPPPPAEGMPLGNFGYSVIRRASIRPEHFLQEPHQIVAAFWRNAGADAAEVPDDLPDDLPPSRCIDPFAFRKALGNILLLEPVEGGTDFVYRLYGTDVARYFGRDMTGRRLREFPSPAATTSLVLYRMLMANRVGLYVEHDAPQFVSVLVRWRRLILPFCSASGEIDRLLVCSAPGTREDAGGS